MTGALEKEIEKVQKLVSHGAESYIVMTNAQCSSHSMSGTRDRVQTWLDDNLPIPSQVWWRDDLDRRLDSQTEIKRTYGFIRDLVGLAELLGLKASEVDQKELIKVARSDRRVSALTKYMMHQYDRDRIVKFKQAELEPQLLDVFIDTPLAASGNERRYFNEERFVEYGASQIPSANNTAAEERWAGLVSAEASSAFMTSNRSSGRPAATVLLSDTMIVDKEAPSTSKVVLEGAPGQGKSTIGQYICQVHRARLLGLEDLERFSPSHQASPVRLPFHVDLRDLAAWLRRQDPFDVRNLGVPTGWSDTLESFLAAQVRRSSGGIDFSVSDLDAVLRATSALLVLDGLDEVPDLNDRRAVVACVNEALNRIEPFSPSFRTLVTSRPSSFSKSPGFSKREYTYFTLGDLPLGLVLEYADGWLESRKIGHQAAHEIREILGLKLGQPHIVDLARNPMQLAILLWLVRKKGPSLPDKRTALYREYMETFLDREAEKSKIVRDERELILDLHGYVAWELHCLAETGASNGSISEPKLKALLKKYLQTRGYPKKKINLVDELFTGMTDRVMVLTSRVQNTFEFEVQPLREFFAARYLYSTARSSSPGAERTGNRSDRFEALLRNPHWWNVTRFYAGFSDIGELANLVDLLEELIVSGDDFSLISYSREVALTLLRDQVFSQKPRSVARLIDLVASETSVSLLHCKGLTATEQSLPADSGGEQLVECLKQRIEKRMGTGFADTDAAKLLAENATSKELLDWWFTKWSRARGRQTRRLWLFIGMHLHVVDALTPDQEKAVVEIMGAEPYLWNILLSSDLFETVPLGTAGFESYMKAFRNGVQRSAPGAASDSSPHGMCITLTSAFYVRYYARHPGRLGYPFYLDESLSAKPYIDLLKEINNLFREFNATFSQANRLDEFIRFHKDLEEILGGECRRTFLVAAAFGEVRSGNLSRKVAGGLCNKAISPVLRSRYARQRRNDEAWWTEQIAAIESENDAFFVLCCTLRWAPISVIASNSTSLEKWIKKLDPGALYVLRTTTGGAPGRPAVDVAGEWYSGRSPQVLYLLSACVGGAKGLDMLRLARGTCRNRELIGLIDAEILSLTMQVARKDLSESIEDIVESYDGYARFMPYFRASRAPRRKALNLASSRELLKRVTELPPSLRYSANETLTGEVARKATPLAVTAASQEWFDRDMVD
ncbi:NACHT domain-containing protein [Actinomadura napierensis]